MSATAEVEITDDLVDALRAVHMGNLSTADIQVLTRLEIYLRHERREQKRQPKEMPLFTGTREALAGLRIRS